MKHLLLPLLLSGCALFQSPCRRADSLVAKAAAKCPDVLLAGDTMSVPGGQADVPIPFTEIEMDSLEAACAQLAEALRAERELFAAALLDRAPDSPLPVNTPPVQRAAEAVRRAACVYAPFTFDHELFTVLGAGGDTPGIQVVVKPRKASQPCPPQVQLNVKKGVATWYRTAFWCICGAIVLGVLFTVFLLCRSATVWHQY